MEQARLEPEHQRALPAVEPRQAESRSLVGDLSSSAVLRLQRSAGNRATYELIEKMREVRSPAHRPAPGGLASLRVLDSLRVQRAVSTWGGDWDTLHYKTQKDAATGKVPVGVDIAIEFKPGKHVDATGIGIVQGLVIADKGAPLFTGPEAQARGLTKGPNKGFYIDQLEGFINPLYPTKAGKAGDTLGSTPVLPMKQPGGGRHGFRFVDKKGTEHLRSAQMNDAPMVDPHGANAKQIFETTAMAFSGHQVGTYYGSVRWGWQTNAKGKFSRLPFTVLSNDVPTTTFAAAAELWNTTKSAAGTAHVRLPVALGRWTGVDTSVVKNPARAIDTELAKLAKNTRLEVTSKGAGEKFNKTAKGGDKWWKVTVVEGPQIGLVGWTMSGHLATKKAP